MAIGKLVILKFLKYCLVGFSGMIVDFATTWFLKEIVKINKYLANSAGFILAATTNYFLNRFWTFHSGNSKVVTEYFSFMFISIIGLAINNILIYWLHDKLNFNFYISKLFSIGVVTVWNFGMNYLFTFS